MPYHIVKSHRIYRGEPYRGPSCERASVPSGRTYDELAEALRDARKLAAVNPVGWSIYDTESGDEITALLDGLGD